METYRKRILLISHEMTYTGAPKSLLEIAKVLKINGCMVDVWSYKEGKFIENYVKEGFEVEIVDEYKAFSDEESIINRCLKYDLIICNTIRTYAYENIIKKFVPTVWLVREGMNIEEFVEMNEDIGLALKQKHHLYVVSEYVQEYLRKEWQTECKVIHNFIPDKKKDLQFKKGNEKIVNFIAIGVVTYRKAFDVLLEAYNGLEESELEKSCLHIIGRMVESERAYAEKMKKLFEQNKRIKYYGEICDNQLVLEKIADSDVAIVVSRDESCSLVAIEAAMLGIPSIVSENVGAKYLTDNDAGWIVKTGNVEQLRDVLRDIIKNGVEEVRKKQVRKNYLETSSYGIFEKNIMQLVEDNVKNNEDVQREYENVVMNEADQWEKLGKNKWERLVTYLRNKGIDINKNYNILLYSASEHACYFYGLLQKRTKINVVAWLDKNYEKCTNAYMQVSSPREIGNYDYDYILVAVLNVNTFKEIKRELQLMGVDEDKIVWVQWRGRLS